MAPQPTVSNAEVMNKVGQQSLATASGLWAYDLLHKPEINHGIGMDYEAGLMAGGRATGFWMDGDAARPLC